MRVARMARPMERPTTRPIVELVDRRWGGLALVGTTVAVVWPEVEGDEKIAEEGCGGSDDDSNEG
jgi:hypothetical protein